MKKVNPKSNRNQAHTSKSPKGLGDFYGTGIPGKIGRMRSGMGMVDLSPKKLGKPPRSLA
jgi:hypothetical protein